MPRNRFSYSINLKGPSFIVNTACLSACKSKALTSGSAFFFCWIRIGFLRCVRGGQTVNSAHSF